MTATPFAVDCPADLPILADYLSDLGHAGEEVARWMVRHRKFPADGKLYDAAGKCGWFYRHKWDHEPDDMPYCLKVVDDGFTIWEWHPSPSAAVWAVVERYASSPVELPE